MKEGVDSLRAQLAALDDADLRIQAERELVPELDQAEARDDRVPGGLCLTATGNGRLLGIRRTAGSWVVMTSRGPRAEPRRWFTIDRAGHVMERIDWLDDGGLGRARVRLAGDEWLEIHPRAATHVLFGPADAIAARGRGESNPSHAAEPEETALTVGGALDWAAIDHLPPLDRPGALPPGGGTALFTLIAELLGDQGRKTVRYRGPYPTRALFDRILAAFRVHVVDVDAARETFIANAEEIAMSGLAVEPPVDFEPAPPERLLLAEGTLAHVRDGIEEVIDHGRHYAAGDPLATIWSGREGLLVAGLTFLGEPLEEHLVLDPRGDLVARIDDRIAGEEDGEEMIEKPFDDRWRRAIAALLVAESASLLARPLRDLILHAPIAWGVTDGRWVEARQVETRQGGWLVHGALPSRFRRRHAAAQPAEREALAGRFIAEVARGLGDPLRRAAQEDLEAKVRSSKDPGSAGHAAGTQGFDRTPTHEGPGGQALSNALLELARDLAARGAI